MIIPGATQFAIPKFPNCKEKAWWLRIAIPVLLATFFGFQDAGAQAVADSLLRSLAALPDTVRINKINKVAIELFASDMASSRQLANGALTQARAIKYLKGEGDALNVLSTLAMRQGKYTEALSMAADAEAIYKSSGDKSGLAGIYSTRGQAYNLQGEYVPALENFTKALKLRQELGQTAFVSRVRENIGTVHFRQGDYEVALNYFNECLEAYRKQGDDYAASKILVNLGATYNKLNRPHDALRAHQESLGFFEKTNNFVGIGIACNNIGSVHYMLKDYPKAIEYYSKSLALKQKLGDKRGMAVSLKNIAEAQIVLNLLDKARINVEESLRIAEEIGSKEQIMDAYDMLSKIFERTGEYKKALTFERKLSQAKDSLFSSDKTEQISRMRAMYETEKAEQESRVTRLEAANEISKRNLERNIFIIIAAALIVVLSLIFYLYRQKQKSNVMLSDKNAVIQKSLQERETLLKEIHHRVKNNLQIISSLLSLQSKNLQDTDAQGAISESRNRVKSMSLIHEQLYQDNTISGVDMKDYMQRLVSSLASAYGLDRERIDIRITSDQVLLDVDSAIPLGLILNELVSNSMKYAFPELRQGVILISLHDMMNELKLVVQDNGVGFDPSAKSAQSFGLNMVNSLMRKLKAEMNVVSSAGTSVELIIRDFKKVNFAGTQ